MKDKDFKDLLVSVEQARKIHKGEMKAARVTMFNPIMVKKIRKKLNASQAEFAYMIGVSVNTGRR